MPDELGGLAKRETNAQGTAAWGEPERILLTCGVAVPAASELPCVEVEGVYWLRDGTRDPLFVFTSYGREPAIDVAIENTDDIAPGVVLSDLSTAVGFTEPNGRECTDIEDSLG